MAVRVIQDKSHTRGSAISAAMSLELLWTNLSSSEISNGRPKSKEDIYESKMSKMAIGSTRATGICTTRTRKHKYSTAATTYRFIWGYEFEWERAAWIMKISKMRGRVLLVSSICHGRSSGSGVHSLFTWRRGRSCLPKTRNRTKQTLFRLADASAKNGKWVWICVQAKI